MSSAAAAATAVTAAGPVAAGASTSWHRRRHHRSTTASPRATTATTGTAPTPAATSASIHTSSATTGVSMSLPILEGLCHQPKAAQVVVGEALTRFVAGRKLALWIRRTRHRRKDNDNNNNNNTIASPSTGARKNKRPRRDDDHANHHWLLESLSSWSRVERQLAARLLLQGACACTACSGHARAMGLQRSITVPDNKYKWMDFSDSESTHWQLQWMIRALLQQHVIEPNHNTTNLSSTLLLPSGVPLEWTGFLKHLVLQPIPTKGSTTTSAGTDDCTTTTNTAAPTTTSHKYYPTDARLIAFANNGIPWVCQSLWKLMLQLPQQLPSHVANNNSQPILQAMLGLMDLINFLLLVVLVEAPNTCLTATSESAVATSPLEATATADDNNKSTLKSQSENQQNSIAQRKLIRQRLGQAVLWKPIKSAPETTTTTTTTNTNSNNHLAEQTQLQQPLSSLACLMGVYHFLKAQSTTGDLQTRTADACVQLLAQIIDPQANVQVVPMTMTAAASLRTLNKIHNHTTTLEATTSAGAAGTATSTTNDAASRNATNYANMSATLRPAGRTRSARRSHAAAARSSVHDLLERQRQELQQQVQRREDNRRRRQHHFLLGSASAPSANAAAGANSSLSLPGSNMPRLLSSILNSSGSDTAAAQAVSAAAAAAARLSSSSNINNNNNHNADLLEENVIMAEVQHDEEHDDHEDDDDDRPPPLAMAHASDVENNQDDNGHHHHHHEESDEDDDEDDDDSENDEEDAMLLDDDEEEEDVDDEHDNNRHGESQEDAAADEGASIDSGGASRTGGAPHNHADAKEEDLHVLARDGDIHVNDYAELDEEDDHVLVPHEFDDEEESDEDDDDDDDHNDDDDDDDVVLGEDEHDMLEAGLLDDEGEAIRLELVAGPNMGGVSAGVAVTSGSSRMHAANKSPPSPKEQQELEDRKRAYLQACMQVLAVQHPLLLQTPLAGGVGSLGSPTPRKVAKTPSSMSPSGHQHHHHSHAHHHGGVRAPILSLAAEQSLLESVLAIIRPSKKPVNTKIIMRRAPTQEEFFRGSLSRNPISLSQLIPPNAPAEYEPTVRDLRRHIADDLQMSDSAELLELLVANKILDVNLKLRVVHQVTWKNHLLESGASSSGSAALSSFLAGGAGGPFFSSGLMFTSSGALRSTGAAVAALGASRGTITADTPLTSLPPLLVTYRLAGVDGEATEDTVSELADPEAPSDAMTTAEVEALMEKEYGMTRILTEGRGSFVLLRSIENHCQDVVRRIRRDNISVQMDAILSTRNSFESTALVGKNPSRKKFKALPPFPGLILLRCSAKLPSNRKRLLQARAPTVLLRLLLDVLNALEDPHKSTLGNAADSNISGSNPTADILQELIESLASDISSTVMAPDLLAGDADTDQQGSETSGTSADDAASNEVQDQDATTLSLVLSSLETISLSPPLRNIIAKLLPFLTYGRANLARELALNFVRHLDLEALVDDDKEESSLLAGLEASLRMSSKANDEDEMDVETDDKQETSTAKELLKSSVLMEAFISTSITLPPSEVCHALRLELIHCGFIERLANFVTKGVPLSPPPWTAALWPQDDDSDEKLRATLTREWSQFYQRMGLRTAFKMLVGLCKNHIPTQNYISSIGVVNEDKQLGVEGGSKIVGFLQACHWIESTSDFATGRVSVRGLGLLSETLLDELMIGNETVGKLVNAIRRQTRGRKKEIAEARRNKALANMSAFGQLAGSASPNRRSADSSARNPASWILGFFPGAAAATSSATRAARATRQNASTEQSTSSWIAEMEQMEDETGLACAVCQEGRNVRPSELLGLYCYVQKVSLPSDKETREGIEGITLLRTLPSSLPKSLQGSPSLVEWIRLGKSVGEELVQDTHQRSAFASSARSRNAYFTTTVSAGNAIHIQCHQKARTADRNHPKAPKSEWEGAILRNSRVNCNVILPLVSSRSSDVPLVAVDAALSEFQTACVNQIGQTSKSMAWTVLHDVRFLVLRMAYGESLSQDCGGGSLASNAQLLLYQFSLCEMFEKDAQLDSPTTAKHARSLSAGYLAASAIVHAPDFKSNDSTTAALIKGLADAAPMACLTCILFHNGRDDCASTSASETSAGTESATNDNAPHPNRRWIKGREYFLRGLILCAGRRHALGLEGSGCVSGRGSSTSASLRSRRPPSFADWDYVEDLVPTGIAAALAQNSSSSSSINNNSGTLASRNNNSTNKPSIDDFSNSLRPFVTLFAFMDVLSENFVLNMLDTQVQECSAKLVEMLEKCQKSKNLRELLSKVNLSLDDHEMMAEFQRGMMAA